MRLLDPVANPAWIHGLRYSHEDLLVTPEAQAADLAEAEDVAKLRGYEEDLGLIAAIAAALEKRTLDEREACAKLADAAALMKFLDGASRQMREYATQRAGQIAEAIRARGSDAAR